MMEIWLNIKFSLDSRGIKAQTGPFPPASSPTAQTLFPHLMHPAVLGDLKGF